eukprot:g46190.t1
MWSPRTRRLSNTADAKRLHTMRSTPRLVRACALVIVLRFPRAVDARQLFNRSGNMVPAFWGIPADCPPSQELP